MSLDLATLFKDKKGPYAVFSGIHDSKAVLSGATQVHHVESDLVANAKEGDRIYFETDGSMTPIAAPAAKKPTPQRTSGNNNNRQLSHESQLRG